MGKTGTYLDNCKIRVAAAILRRDQDNPSVNRLLATSEGTRGFFSIVGGKVDPGVVGVSYSKLEEAILENRDALLAVAEEEGNLNRAHQINPNRKLFEWFDTLADVIESRDLREQLLLELEEETGLGLKPKGINRKWLKSIPYILTLEPFTVYFEKLYGEDGILVSPVYKLKLSGSNVEINKSIDETIRKQNEKLRRQASQLRDEGKEEEAAILLRRGSDVKERRWFSSTDLTAKDVSSYAQPSLIYVGARLVEKGLMTSPVNVSNGNDYDLKVLP